MNNNIRKKLSKTFNTKVSIKKKNRKIIEGREEETLEDYYSCWCNPKELYGKEFYEVLNTKLNNVLVFETRYCEKIRAMADKNINKNGIKDFYITFNGCNYNVFHIDFMNNSKEIVLLKCKEVI